jgi:hypothetical protein
MNWRELAWEGIVSALSWIIAIVALVGVAIYVAVIAIKRHRSHHADQKLEADETAVPPLQMETAS